MMKKIKISLIIFAIIQIILLLNMPVANSYEIAQVDKIVVEKNIEKDFGKKILGKSALLIIGFLSIKQIGIVSAQEVQLNCCLETLEGELCKEFVTGQENNCKSDLIESECDKISSCERGCCIDGEEGLCSPNSLRQDCVSSGGEWKNEESCAIIECQKGCCVLGDESQFVEEARCQKVSNLFGFQKDFRQQIKSEIACLSLGASAVKGACVYAGGRCEYQSEVECLARGGEYNARMLCSNPELETDCKKQDSVGCVDGKDEIYWFDSCGNRENIYSSDKEASWNNGYLLSKQESCNPNSANINSEDCGNCLYLLGSKCSETKIGEIKIKDGNFVCKDLKCVDETGRIRNNGESWCIYDGQIGEGKDVVGSRHWKRMCIDGEIKVEACADYRGQICVQSEIEKENSTDKFSISSCVINEAAECINYNSKKDTMIENCEKNNMCYLKKINVDEGFKFDICLPQYPKGNDLAYEGDELSEGGICKMANQKCTVIYTKKTSGWKCVYNCNCEEAGFGNQMNDFCISLGDCGSYVNFIGDGTDNSVIKNAPKVSWEDYKDYAEAIAGQFAKPKSIEELLTMHRSSNPEAYDPTESSDAKINEAIGMVSNIVGGIGAIISGLGYLGVIELSTITTTGVGPFAAMMGLGEPIAVQVTSTPLGAFSGALGAFAVGLTVSSLLTMAFGLEGQAATIMAVAGAAAGVAIAVAYLASDATSLLSFCLEPTTCLVAIIILIILAIVLKVMGIGKTKEVIVSFECLPWEAPAGSDKCGECNGDPLKPCSKYRCESLGQACKLLNEDSENPICEKVVNDFKPPIISPGNIGYGYNFVNEETWSVRIERDNGACIPEFASVLFQLNTDEPAQCKFEFQRKDSYEEMENYALDLNSYVSNHSFGIMMPSLSSLEIYNLSGDIRQMFGNMNMYVRCQDYYGDVNTREYAVNFCIESGPDLTPAYPTKFEPKDGSFLKYLKTETPLKIYLNEPAECKYDKEDREYNLMRNEMQCNTDLEKADEAGWPCFANLTGLTNKENTIYIKCKDQPWFKNTANESQRNINTNGFIYTISKTENPLKIDYIVPEGDIEAGVQPVAVDFEVRTSGGAYYGDSVCSYNFDGSENFVQFRNTFSNLHTQNINQLMNGPYIIDVKCEDEVGNIAKDSSEVNIIIDENPPEVVRAYEEYGQLIIQTDEEAECYYSSSKCRFNIENATSMTIGYSTEHSTFWNPGVTYYIKCIDIWGNRPDECTIKLLPDFF